MLRCGGLDSHSIGVNIMHLSTLNKEFLFAMVQSMYKYECSLINTYELLNDKEIHEFYMSYLCVDKL